MRRVPAARSTTSPASFSTLRCCETAGRLTGMSRASSTTALGRSARRSKIARRVGSPSAVSPSIWLVTTYGKRSLTLVAVSSRWGLLGPIPPEQVVGLDPLLGDDRRAERELAAEHRGGHDLGELVDVALAVAAEHLEALALGGEARAAGVGRHDQRGDRDRHVVVAVRQDLTEVERGGR